MADEENENREARRIERKKYFKKQYIKVLFLC